MILVASPPLSKWYDVRFLQVQMQEQMRAGDFDGWPPEETDPVLFATFGDYYQAIARFFHFDPVELTVRDRHLFFIGDRPCGPDNQLSLSVLDKLLGLDYTPFLPQSSKGETIETTEFEDLDAIVALNLLWKESAGELMQHLSLQEVLRVMEVGGEFLSRQGDRPDHQPINSRVYEEEEKELSQEEQSWIEVLKSQGFAVPSE